MIENEKSETDLLDDDGCMEEPANVSVNNINSLPASAAPLPSLSRELAHPEPDSMIPIIRQQPQEAATLMPSSTPCITQSFDSSLVPPLPLTSDGLYKFLDTDVNIFTSDGPAAQLQFPSADGNNLSTESGCVPNLSQAADDALDPFPLSLPFIPVTSSTPSQNPPFDIHTPSS